MLKRIAVLFWWCGMAVLVATAWQMVDDVRRLTGCEQAKKEFARLGAEWDRQFAQATKNTSPNEDPVIKLLGGSENIDVPGLKEARERAEACDKVYEAKWSSLPLALLALPFFAACFVLGGTFWRPPKLT